MKKVFIQGLGFVGSAMVTAVAASKDSENKPRYKVIGVDLNNEVGNERAISINKGIFPLPTSDERLRKTLLQCQKEGNIEATTEQNRFNEADIIVVDIPLDIPFLEEKPILKFEKFEEAIRNLGSQVKKDTLIIIETTVPPGTCEKIVIPALEEELKKRNMSFGAASALIMLLIPLRNFQFTSTRMKANESQIIPAISRLLKLFVIRKVQISVISDHQFLCWKHQPSYL